MRLTLTLHREDEAADWQWLCTGPDIRDTGHLDRDDPEWGALAYGWRHPLWGDAAPWVLAALYVHHHRIHGRADADACEIVCAGMTPRIADMIHRGDWSGTDLERHVSLLRASPGTLVCGKLSARNRAIVEARVGRAAGIDVVGAAILGGVCVRAAMGGAA